MTLHLIRHAESVGNASDDYAHPDADSLSPLGRRQARDLARRLRRLELNFLFTSPLGRACQTLAPYLRAVHGRAEIWPELAETCWQFEGDPPDAVAPDPATRYIAASPAGDAFSYRGGQAVRPADDETFAQGLGRVALVKERLLGEFGGSDASLLIMTHGIFLRELLNLILGCRSRIRFPHDNTGITRLSFAGRWKLHYANRV